MKLKNLSIATALLLALTGCGSSGGGNSDNRPTTPNNEIKNNQTTQNQANTQQAELDRLKAQLSQAQNEKQTAEDKLKQAEQLSAQDLNKAKAGLQKAQEELAAAQKALDEKLSLEKTLTRDEVFQFALHNGLNTVDSSEFADNFKNNSKSFVTEQLVEVHKIIALKRLARSYSLSEDEVSNFVNANKDKTLNEARTLLNGKRTERENLINELTALAKQKGLEEWEARNFAYGKNYTDKESAVQDLNNYIAEKAKRKTKIDELINLAKEKGLDDWEAQNFANANVDNDKANALENLNQLAAEKEKQKAEQEKERLQADKEQKIHELVEKYKNTYFPNLYNFNPWEFSEKNKDKSLEEVQTELDKIKTHREEIAELAKILKDLKLNDYSIAQFIDENTFLSFEEAQANLDKKVTETINILKNSIYNDPSYGGTPLDKSLGFLAKEDLVTKKDPIIENDRETDRFTTTTTYSDIYNQKYSVVTGNYHKQDAEYKEFEYYYEDGDDRNASPRYRYVNRARTTENYDVNDARGFKTPVDKFPTEGKATYNGVAFDAKKQGELTYTVNFAERKGSGEITGLDHIGDITLQEADLYKSASEGNMKIKGYAVANDWQNEGGVTGNYNVDFFGPNAEEIAGKITLSQGQYKFVNNRGPFAPDKHINESVITTGQPINGNSYSTPTNSFDIGFGGTRGEIQK